MCLDKPLAYTKCALQCGQPLSAVRVAVDWLTNSEVGNLESFWVPCGFPACISAANVVVKLLSVICKPG